MIKKNIFTAFIILICLATTSCEEDSNNTQISLLKKSWTNSYEESLYEKSFTVYRPSDYMDFPPSRYRQVFNFKEDDICSYSVLAPNDGHYMSDGIWKFYKSKNIIKIFNKDYDVLYEFKILELTEDILKLK